MKFYILDEDKNPVETTMDHWALAYENFEKCRRVARHERGKEVVSTVFLGIDHNFLGEGPPIVFETMSFPDEFQERYATWNEALAGHYRRCEVLWGKDWQERK
jgi:hypothetical protein